MLGSSHFANSRLAFSLIEPLYQALDWEVRRGPPIVAEKVKIV